MLKKSVSLAAKLYYRIKHGLKNAVVSFLSSKAVKNFAAKYPKAYVFIVQRFSPDEFTGLPVTFLILSFIANLLLLDEIVDAFIENPFIVTTDQFFTKLMYSMRVEWIAQAFYYFTMFGSFGGVVSIAIISTVVFVITKHKTYILPVWIALLGTQFTVGMSKNYFHRVRPVDFSYYPETSFSFPSGHATVAMAFYGVLFYAIIRSRKLYASKFRWLIAAILFIGMLGFSRLYLCVHYVSDIMAGYSLGLLWMLLAISIREWLIHRKKKKLNSYQQKIKFILFIFS